MTTVPAVRREIVVPASPAIAFEVFTSAVGTWWPVADFSVHGAAATVAFTNGEIVESAPGADPCSWGTVLTWDPPTRLVFTWHPGRDPDSATTVEVGFQAVDGGTAVRLVHRGWEALADPAAGRDSYDRGWPVVLAAYASAFPVT